jgi:redox-sensitive bicupin YhaK (pirin superfamily)
LNVSSNNTTGSVTAGWSASLTSGATYVLERADNGGAFVQVYAGSALSHSASLPNGSYLFRVKAVKSGYSDSAWKTSTPCEVVLVAGMPATLSVPTSNTTGSVTAGWSASLTPGAIYVLERADNGGAFTQVYEGNLLSYTSTLGNGSYVFRIKATKTGFADSAWKTSTTCNVLLTASMPATLSVPTSSTTGKVTASWSVSATSGATYVLERSDNGGAFSQVYAGSLRTYTETVPLPNGSYVYRVKAVKDGYVASTWKTSATCVVTR